MTTTAQEVIRTAFDEGFQEMTNEKNAAEGGDQKEVVGAFQRDSEGFSGLPGDLKSILGV